MHDPDGSATSIGQEDQLRDRDMLRDERRRDSMKVDAEADGATDASQAPSAGGLAPAIPQPGEETQEEWRPGDPDQPDRSTSEGLSGSGPAQPDP